MMILDRAGNKLHLTDEEMYFNDSLGKYGKVYQEDTDSIGVERFFFHLPKDQTEIMISMYLGLKPSEIVKIHRFRNIGRFYSMSAKLRDSYKSMKGKFLGYN